MVVSQLGTRKHRPFGRATRVAAALAAIGLVSLGATACSSGKATSAAVSTTSTDTSASSSGGVVSIVMISGATSDPLFSTVKRGADAAAAGYGSKVKLTYLPVADYDNLGPDVAKLESTALAQNPSIVVSPNWVPTSQNPAFAQIVAKGIPVLFYNAGEDQTKKVGAVTYVGSDEYLAGKAGGQKFVDDGLKHVLCVNTVPGAANVEARCDGVKDGAEAGGASSTELSLPSANFGNPTAVTQAIKAALLKDSSIDAVITIGSADADSAAGAIKAGGFGDRVKLGAFNVSDTELTRIKGGTQLFAIDQQPYLQGYMSISTAYQYVAYGLLPPQNPLLTGPLLITKDNVDKAIEGTKLGVR